MKLEYVMVWCVGLSLCLMAGTDVRADAAERGLVADYAFRSSGGGETVLRDESGNGNHGTIHGARWTRAKQGFCLFFDGQDDYVDCGDGPSLDVRTAVTVETWVKPASDPGVDAGIAGKHFSIFGLTLYKGRYWWYVSSGGNNVKGAARIGAWQHVVGAFDGHDMTLYIDGRLVASGKSKLSAIHKGRSLFVGCMQGDLAAKDPLERQSGYFHGMIGRVRVYNRALPLEEVRSHYVAEAHGYVDALRVDKLRVRAYPYFSKKRVVAAVDYSSLLSVPPDTPIKLEIAAFDSGKVVATRDATASEKELAIESDWPLAELAPGRYLLRASFGKKQAECPFDYAEASEATPAPPEKRVAPKLPESPGPVPYDFQLSKGGGFSLRMGGVAYPFESVYSYPHGGENRLAVSGRSDRSGEKSWRVKGRKLSAKSYAVQAQGSYYTLNREIELFPNHIAVRDTFRNRTDEPLGMIIRNHMVTRDKGFTESYLAGNRSVGVRREEYSPSVFMGKQGLGVGIVPLDDVYVVQCALYAQNGEAGVSTDKFALDAKASYTLEWSVYPNGTGDYYDFVNAFRKDEGRIGTVEGGLDIVTRSMSDRTLTLTPDFVRRRNLKYAVMPCLSQPVDDPAVSIEGIEFMDFPKDMAVIKSKMAEMHGAYPQLKGMFHVAHSLYVTDRPDERFPDSRVILSDGRQAIWEDSGYSYIRKERQDAGWKWWIFYPTPGNSFHRAMMKSVDVMMNDLGCRGVFTDGLMNAYISPYTYDRWDGHTAEIDPATKTIKRKMGSVLLLSQPSVVEYIRKVNAAGGTVIANNCIITRTFAREKVVVNREVITPDTHLAPTVMCLGTPSVYLRGETAFYRDILKSLDYGSLYFLCGIGGQIRADSIAARMYPITFEEIRSGMVKGPERIITARSGVYGWRGSADLCFVYRYDGRGVRVANDCMTTVDSAGARTAVALGEYEAVVLERLPVSLHAQQPVNVSVTQYDARAIRLALNGHGAVRVAVRAGDFAVEPKVVYRAAASRVIKATVGENGEVSFALELNGATRLAIEKLP